MSSPRPSADELERLIEQVRRDPGSRAFVALADAHLALGRARDAVEVAASGLRARPDDVDGRVALARGLAALHQWKEAQAELLKVVKVDRNHKGGFALLGEVLLRRGDFERALPVLQHAQNLDPSNPQVLAMVRKARSGQPLDPPPPIPTPMEPVRTSGSGERAKKLSKPPPTPRVSSRSATDLDNAPTSIGGPFAHGDDVATREERAVRDDPTDITRSPHGDEVTGEITDEPTRSPGMRGGHAPAPPSAPPDSLRRGRPSAPPPMGQMAQKGKAGGSPAPEPVMPAVRPRVISGAKPPNPAAEALRQSAAAGENYLNDLLTGGLLEVPGVRVPDSEFDIRPDRRWGRSGGRALVALFVLLVLGAGGGVAYWYYSEQAKTEAVKKHRAAAAELLVSGSWDDLDGSARELAEALKQDSKNPRVFADVAWVTSLQTLLYGISPVNAEDAIAQAERDITEDKHEGYREVVLARAAVALATLQSESDADASLARARSTIEQFIADHPDDRWARWLLGRSMLAAGERASAKATLRSAADGDEGIVPAMIDLADLLVDDGSLDEAITLYGRALAVEPNHPLALVGQVLAWAERGVEREKTLSILNVELSDQKNMGPRVRQYRALALALAKYQNEKYEEFDTLLVNALDQAPKEPRYYARVALARLLAGDFPAAARARAQVAWFGKGKPEPDPVVLVFDAALLVESGLPQRALEVLGDVDNTRAHLIRAQANIDLGGKEYETAIEEAEKAKASAPDNLEAEALLVWARVLSTPAGKKRDDLIEGELDAIANKMISKRGVHAEGAALYAIGAPTARERLEEALAKVDAENPNPIAYRTHTLLARLDLAEGKGQDAATHLEAAIAANGGYLPALVVQARLFLAAGDADAALESLKPVLLQAELVTFEVELAHAEARAARTDATEADKKEATEALQRALKAGAPAAEVGRIAALISADLPATLGVPGPEGEEEPEDKKPEKKKKKRRR